METEGKELTSAAEDYLKAIYALDAEGKRATTSALAERMFSCVPSSVRGHVREAQEEGYTDQLREGFRFLWRTPIVRAIVIMSMIRHGPNSSWNPSVTLKAPP